MDSMVHKNVLYWNYIPTSKTPAVQGGSKKVKVINLRETPATRRTKHFVLILLLRWNLSVKNKNSSNVATSPAILAMYKDKTEIAGRLESQQRI
jgi:hypothetical protein